MFIVLCNAHSNSGDLPSSGQPCSEKYPFLTYPWESSGMLCHPTFPGRSPLCPRLQWWTLAWAGLCSFPQEFGIWTGRQKPDRVTLGQSHTNPCVNYGDSQLLPWVPGKWRKPVCRGRKTKPSRREKRQEGRWRRSPVWIPDGSAGLVPGSRGPLPWSSRGALVSSRHRPEVTSAN